MDPGYGLGHAVRYLLFRGRLVQGEQGGDALRHGLGGDDDYALFGQRDALLRGHDDVLVVGQDENGLCGRAVYLGEYVLGGGVHGLAAATAPKGFSAGAIRGSAGAASPPAISLCCSRMFSIFTLSSGP